MHNETKINQERGKKKLQMPEKGQIPHRKSLRECLKELVDKFKVNIPKTTASRFLKKTKKEKNAHLHSYGNGCIETHKLIVINLSWFSLVHRDT